MMTALEQPKRRGRPASRLGSGLDLLADVPEPTAEAVQAALAAADLSLESAAHLLGLAGRQSMARLTQRGTDRATLALLLLATGQHPTLTAQPRH